MRLKPLLFPIFLVLIFLFATEILGKEFTIRSYILEDGLPSLRVNDVLQDDSGLLWFASDNEIFTYDGLNWEIRYSTDKVDDPHYRKLIKDEKGKIWALPIYGEDSLIYYDGMMRNSLPPIGELTINRVNQTSIDVKYNEEEIEVYVGTEENGIFLFKNEKWLNLSFPYLTSLTKVNNLKLFNGKLYFASKSGLYVYDTNSEAPKFITLLDDNILNFCIDKTGQPNDKEPKIWLLGEDWVGYFENSKLTILSNEIDLIDFIHKIDADNEFIYIAAKQKLWLINKRDGKQSFLNKVNFYSKDGANSIFIDREKNIWAVNNRGVHKIRKSLFTNFNSKDGLFENEVTAIEFFKDDAKLLGHNRGLTLVNDGAIKTIDFINSLPINDVHSRVLSSDRNKKGNILFTSQSYGLGEIDASGNIRWYRFEEENFDFMAVHRDSKENVWVSSKFSLYKLVNGKLIKSSLFNENDFKKREWIRVISSTKAGSLLLGTSINGIIIIEENAKKIVTSEIAGGNDIFSIHENKNGDIFAGTLDGLYIVKNDKLVKFKKGNFRIDQPVFFIQPDLHNNLWFGLDNGVIKWDGENYFKYSTSDGLAGEETNRAAGKVDKYGNFWIGTNDGLSRYPANNFANEVKPLSKLLFIETGDGKKYGLNSDTKFDDRVNSAVLHFRGISFIDEKHNKNKVRLINVSTNEEVVLYSNTNEVTIDELPPGEYEIFLSTQNANGVWGDEIKSSVITNPRVSYSTVLILSFIGAAVIVAFVSIVNAKKYFSRKENVSKSEQSLPDGTNDKYDNPKIVKLKSLLEDDKVYMSRDISLSELASLLNTNKTHLSKLINSSYRQNFKSLINSYRVKEAKKMLADPSYHNYTIEAISEMTGFKSKSAFHKAFKEFNKVTPYQFKMQNINS